MFHQGGRAGDGRQRQQRQGPPTSSLTNGSQGRIGGREVTTRRLSAFIDALAAGRRPRSFQADPEDVEMLRVAIALRAARPGDSAPDENFVAELHEQLADSLSPSEPTNIHPIKMHRGRV